MPRSFAFGTGHEAALLAAVLPFLALACSGGAPPSDGEERAATRRTAIVGGIPSTPVDDFVVYLGHAGAASFTCGATLIAPNLIVTAKHCVYKYVDEESVCEATGEPREGSVGGYVTDQIPLAEISIFGGADGKNRAGKGAPPQAVAKQVIDDASINLCSHDLAYVVLDKPVTGLPIAKVRLGKRPTEGAAVAVAGWGQVEDRSETKFRQRRTGVTIERVGPAVAGPTPTGTLGPRTFESGPGACAGDSGSPAFDLATGTVLGVVTRALNVDKGDPVSPCLPASVAVVYVTVVDSPIELHRAFAAAGAEPWLEGQPSAGYRRFKEECASDLECEGGRCVGASAKSTGVCNVDCAGTDVGVTHTCPTGFACANSGLCEVPPPAPPPPPTTTTNPDAAPEPEAKTSGCASAPGSPGNNSPLWLVGACVALARRMRIGRRARRASSLSSRGA